MANFAHVLSQQTKPLNIIYLSSYIPRKCGIATYTKDLTNAINLLNSHSLAEIMVVNRPEDQFDYPWEAKFKINQPDLAQYLAAAEYINHSHADLVSLQHEFGLFGGDTGEYIVHFAEAVKKPLVTTFHTVTPDPQDHYGFLLKRIANASQAIVVMMESIADRLVTKYHIPRKKIVVIPHGVPDLPLAPTASAKKQKQLDDRLILGNINLLSINKGIEDALAATAIIARRYPEVLYTVIGQTHPVILEREGEKYRQQLKDLVRKLHLEKNVRFVNKYLTLPDLINWIKAIDFYITPYLDPHQITSGALAYAIGAGKTCISTPYVYAQEVLSKDRGIIVPFRDPDAIARAVLDLHEHPGRKQAMEQKAYDFGRLMTWPYVAQHYLNLFRTVLTVKNKKASAVQKEATRPVPVPKKAPASSSAPLQKNQPRPN